MRTVGLVAAIVLGGFVSSPPPALRVLRVAPAEQGDPTAVVTVTFDKPVAGQLDGTVDPRTFFTISPAVEGRLEWRDPITVRFTPAEPLTPGSVYTVGIANTFSAMDGSRLVEPYRFSFRVAGPRALDGSPASPFRTAQFLSSDTEFEVLFSTPVVLDEVSRSVRLELSGCSGPSSIALTAVSQQAPTDRDLARYRWAGGYNRDRRADALRRVVRLRPARPLPPGCSGRLSMPAEMNGAPRSGGWSFETYGPLRLQRVVCTNDRRCPTGRIMVTFSTPVRGSEVLRTVGVNPAINFTVSDTAAERDGWVLEATLRPRTTYQVTVDASLRDVFGQRLAGNAAGRVTTDGYQPSVGHATGRMLVERESFRTLAVRHVNVDSLIITQAAVPESLEARLLGAPYWGLGEQWSLIEPFAATRAMRVASSTDTPLVSAIRLPAYNAARPGAPTLTAVRITARGAAEDLRNDEEEGGGSAHFALVQVTDLGIAARLGTEEAIVWVTTVHDGAARPGASVVLHDRNGQVRARGTTDAQGLVRLTGLAADTGTDRRGGFEGYVAVTWQNDRALLGFDAYAWELSPWRFNVSGAWGGSQRLPAAAAVFTERGIYRPGEVVHAKAIVRTGALGALRAPAAGDSLRWKFYDREMGSLRDTTVAASAFGTSDQALPVPAGAPLGSYRVGVQLKRGGEWTELAAASYRVAEYRPPEFLVTVTADTVGRLPGDSLDATIEARYLFGAPMARTPVAWTVRRAPMSPWQLRIPGMDNYYLGESGSWWEEQQEEGEAGGVESVGSGTDTLDAAGRFVLRTPVQAPRRGRPARLTLQATVTDVNRQSVTGTATTTVHPAAFYLAARPSGDDYFWTAGTPVSVGVLAVRPDGQRLPGVAVRGTIVRREWHRVQRRRDGLDERVGEWVSDTVAQCSLTTTAEPEACRFTPSGGGTYILTFRASDQAGREASTSFYRWATGRDWVPWGDENQFKMDVIPDRTSYDVGDTATVLFASPFTDAEAWITVEREGLIEQRRLRITAGATTLKLPLSEAYVPNAFVSIVVVRGRSAPAGGIADPGRPTIRVGYAEVKVVPRIKRLAVNVQPLATEYRPGDSARVRVRVRDSRGAGRRSEVTLWAVDEGVLSLTGYRTPDPVALLYRERGVAMRLASNLIAVAPQVSDSEGVSIKGEQAPGGGGGQEGGDILRSRFSSTAFFLGSVVTDENGEAVAAARLPDNLTTFRVMAVAVTTGDRYGSGESSMLVTRPLLARPALPRFLRRDDRFVAGVVVNQRAGGTPTVQVRANARGAVITAGTAVRTGTLAAGRGTEIRFPFRDTTADTASFRFDVSSGRDSDAVLTRLPVRPSNVPRAYAASGVVGLTSGVDLTLPADIDPERSRMVFSIGTTPLALIGAMYRHLAVYPFECTEQVTSAMLPLIALHRAGADEGGRSYAPPNAKREIEEGVAVLSRRQRPDGGIGIWAADDWTTAWLSAYAGQALVEARAAGIAVSDTVLARLATYLTRSLRRPERLLTPVSVWFEYAWVRHAESVAAADFLSRLGQPDLAAENELLRVAPQLYWEDRVRLADIVARRGATDAARRLLSPIWANVRVEGRRAVIPDSVRSFYFYSSRRPVARLLSATLAVDSGHALIAPLVETLIEQSRAARGWWWNTADLGAAAQALADFTVRQRRAARRGFTVAGAGRVLFRSSGEGDVMREYSSSLTGLLAGPPAGPKTLSLTIAAPAAERVAPLYYHVTVHEVPRVRPTTPDQEGIAVERWYEDYNTRQPIVSVQEGALVRVRLRITIPDERRFLALTDPLPAGLEAIDLSLRTSGVPGPAAGPAQPDQEGQESPDDGSSYRYGWAYGRWDSGWWSPFDHREMRDDRVAWVATYLWPGTYTTSYLARATTPGVFIRPPAHAEEMYNPSVRGRSDGGTFTVTRRGE